MAAGLGGSLGYATGFAIGVGLPDATRYAAECALLPPDGHEFVNNSSLIQCVSAGVGEPSGEITAIGF
jgi:hypothetical protein